MGMDAGTGQIVASVLTSINFFGSMANTAIVAVSVTVLVLFFDSLAAFAQDSPLPSDPRVIYTGGDTKMKYAVNIPGATAPSRAARGGRSRASASLRTP